MLTVGNSEHKSRDSAGNNPINSCHDIDGRFIRRQHPSTAVTMLMGDSDAVTYPTKKEMAQLQCARRRDDPQVSGVIRWWEHLQL